MKLPIAASRRSAWWVPIILLSLLAAPLAAQQSGSISGEVTTADGQGLPGVTVTASGDTLPSDRVVVTAENGEFRLRLLPPGTYTLQFALDGMATVERQARVVLDQNVVVDVSMGPEAVTETVQVIGTAPVIDLSSSEIKASVDSDVIEKLPVGQEYRDLFKLIPGVQYTEDNVRGPSAGGNGQDNVYQFDGVDVSLPLFGTLSAEPSSVDIEQVTIIKGGAKATNFNRSGGFLMDTVSKSGTSEYKGEISYQVQTSGMTADRDVQSEADFEQDQDWTTANFGGPIVRDKANFYVSYYRPTIDRDNRSNLYGPVPNFESTRDELFGKLTLTPTASTLFNLSYRDSDREANGSSVGGEATAGTASTGDDATLTVGILEGTWVLGSNGFLSGRFTTFENETSGRPDNLLGFDIRDDGSVALDVGNLDRQGLFQVPTTTAADQAFARTLIDRYGYLENGVRQGGGLVGVGTTINDQDFYRDAFEISYDHTLFSGDVSHDLHFGYSWSKDGEDLSRQSNGWGFISYIGGNQTVNGTPVYFEARFEQQSLLSAGGVAVPPINSEFETQSFEINDTIRMRKWTFNVGVLVSNDELFGEGLRPNPNTPSGFELAVGNQYKMYEIDWDEMIQPRLGITRELFDGDTVYANYARYHPAAGSLPRAASWARNLRSSIDAQFDRNGNLLAIDPVESSSGKYFDEGLEPRYIDEYLIGYSRQFSPRLTGKYHFRHRYAGDFWEDTNNNARSAFRAPAGFPQEDYIPNLNDFRFGPQGIGGSSYVIAQLDGAFTKFYELNAEMEYRGDRTFVRGSYVWSQYYGTFDQDNTTTDNDAAIFIGSSFLADGAGRQIWDNRYGYLRGDRRHQVKTYATYDFNWNGSAGIYAIFQSGQPWEAWDVEVYRSLTGSSSDTSRYAEPAGSRTTDDHYQIDLNYTHRFRFAERYRLELRADLFNVFDNQTGYNIQNKVNSAGFGVPRTYFDPQRLQLQVRFGF
ncbi:MAG: carboxypeptidase regulatory-like domain-containing protein [Acidobacteria bacterium]|nr:MAG: carboxypeptidase regulatory-like domain-containing protein [Acidobacteriota bacterium]REK00397.1 MAG: carboxypeptidase regulatory-like domain-containing protein [Acidobacteriota bacterium]